MGILGNKLLNRKKLSAIARTNLVFYVDAGNINSYPGSGTAWNDLSGNNNGTITGASYSSDGGGCINFVGASGNLALFPTPSEIVTGGIISIDAWVKWQTAGNSISDIQCILDNNHSGVNGFVIQDLPFENGQLGIIYSQTIAPVGDNTWKHICGTLSNTQSKTYVNGTLIKTDIWLTGLNTIQPNISFAKWQGGTRYLTGKIAVARIYSKVLTAAEILQNFNVEKTRFGL